jgi:DNA-entry nuclease
MKYSIASKFKRFSAALIALIMLLSFALAGCAEQQSFDDKIDNILRNTERATSRKSTDDSVNGGNSNSGGNDQSGQDPICLQLGIAGYSGSPFAHVNGGVPSFTESEITTDSYEFYSELDGFGRCGYAMACIGKDLMPSDDREEIGSVTPTGWVQKKYSAELVSGGYIYNRCHLIGFQLTGENANKKNLITGTRYMNWDGMVEFENMIADYIKETDNHVMYRVTPMFYENELVARGVHMEAYSVEDSGEGISFNVYVYNVQPGIMIDYKTGNSWLSGEQNTNVDNSDSGENGNENNSQKTYILNTSSHKIHSPDCSKAVSISDSNKREYTGNISDLGSEYTICGVCKAGEAS